MSPKKKTSSVAIAREETETISNKRLKKTLIFTLNQYIAKAMWY